MFVGLGYALLKAGVFSRLSQGQSSGVIHTFLKYAFWLSVIAIIFGVIYGVYRVHENAEAATTSSPGKRDANSLGNVNQNGNNNNSVAGNGNSVGNTTVKEPPIPKKESTRPTQKEGRNSTGNVNQNGNNNNVVVGNGNSVGNTVINRGPELEGLLMPRSDSTPSNPCGAALPDSFLKLFIGGTAVAFPPTFPVNILEVEDDPQITLDKVGNRLTLNMKVFDSDPDSRIIATIEQNRFTVNPNNYFKIDFPPDHSMLSVTDQHNVEALKVDYVNERAMKISANLYFQTTKGRGFVLIDDSKMRIHVGDVLDIQVSGSCYVDSHPESVIGVFPSKRKRGFFVYYYKPKI